MGEKAGKNWGKNVLGGAVRAVALEQPNGPELAGRPMRKFCFFSPNARFFPKIDFFCFLWQFSEAECARRALEQLNGFELAGRPMRVGQLSERPDGAADVAFPEPTGTAGTTAGTTAGSTAGITAGIAAAGITAPLTCGDEPELGTAAGRLQLMAKLAEGSGLQLPAPAQAALQQLNGALNPLGGLNPAALTALSPALNLASQCLTLSGLFSPQTM
ncbi:putative RNA-binding protein 23 [Passerculus sandwichensis]